MALEPSAEIPDIPDTDDEKVVIFADRVKEAYLDLWGGADLNEQPFVLGGLIVGLVVDYLDGGDDIIVIRKLPRLYALGIARQMVCDLLDA